MDHPCCQGDCIPASAIRQGRSVGSAVLPWRLCSNLCNQTRTLSWISRVARETVFQPLQSDTDALLVQPSRQGDCVPAFAMRHRRPVESPVLLGRLYSRRDCIPAIAIRHGRSLCEESAVQLFLFGGTRADRAGNSVVHKLMDAMSSALKLRGAGLTPHFHAEFSSNGTCGGPPPVRN